MFEDDRPINPDLKYLQEKNQQYKQQLKKNAQDYLHKGSHHLLPCYKQLINEQEEHQPIPRQKLSKAQQYQLIRKNNRQKFGEWQKHPTRPANEEKESKKLKPSQMSVNYKPKVVNIDTREYKNPNYVQNPQRYKKPEEIDEKKEYQRMIEYMKKLYGELEKEKEQFGKQKQYLMFKKVIEKQPGVQIKPKINTGLTQSYFKPDTTSLVNNQNSHQMANENAIPQDHEESPNESSKIHRFHYPINKLHECNPFTIRQIYKYVQAHELVPENTQFYQTAKKIVEQERSSAKVKTIKPNCTHGSIGANHAVCLEEQCAEKRITKFSEGWFELWVAGRYRTVYNQNTGYKVVWYNNGDIKQQFTAKKVQFYHSKAKKVVQVKVGQNLPFWYYPFIGQLEMKNSKGDTEVIFADGRHEIVVAEKNS